jgi:hypothetical protein
MDMGGMRKEVTLLSGTYMPVFLLGKNTSKQGKTHLARWQSHLQRYFPMLVFYPYSNSRSILQHIFGRAYAGFIKDAQGAPEHIPHIPHTIVNCNP